MFHQSMRISSSSQLDKPKQKKKRNLSTWFLSQSSQRIVTNRESAEIERLERFAADLIDGRRDWTDIMVSYKTNSNLVKHSIWLISFCSWFPLLNLLLTMSTFEGLLEMHTEKDKKSECDQIGMENALVNIPLCIY